MKKFLKNWTLPIAIAAGIALYETYSRIPALDFTRPYAPDVVAVVQPLLIFTMLFLTFCKVNLSDMRPRRVHLWLLLVQVGSFALGSLALRLFPDMAGRVTLEAAMLCMICPTATSAAVVTARLHGDAADITTYTLFVNLAVALAVPLCVPLIHPHASVAFFPAFVAILGKVCPLLLLPLIAAQVVKKTLPGLWRRIVSLHSLAFYLWAIALCIAIAVSVRAIHHSDRPAGELAGIAAASLLCCIFQFALGRFLGKRSGTPISSGQSLGQKNTVFAIWMGYTFLEPVTSIAGGFYSVWHNLYNTWQMAQTRRRDAQEAGESK